MTYPMHLYEELSVKKVEISEVYIKLAHDMSCDFKAGFSSCGVSSQRSPKIIHQKAPHIIATLPYLHPFLGDYQIVSQGFQIEFYIET